MPSVTKQNNKPAVKKKAVGGKHTTVTGNGRTGIAAKFKPIGFDDTEGIKILLYGRSGTGKTTCWGTFPGPILAVVISGGKRPGELRSIDTPENRDKIVQIAAESVSDVREVIEYQKDVAEFSTIVLDHASGLQDLALKEITGLDKIPEQKTWGMASQQQYGQCTSQCKEILSGFLSLACNVVIVAQEREFNTEGESDILMPFVGAALTPSLTGWLNPACDYIAQTFLMQKTEEVKSKIGGKDMVTTRKTKGVNYCLRTGPDPVFTTKFRVPKGRDLPDYISDPTYDKIMELIQGG